MAQIDGKSTHRTFSGIQRLRKESVTKKKSSYHDLVVHGTTTKTTKQSKIKQK